MPVDEGRRFDDHECASPIEETRQRKQHDAGDGRNPSRLRFALLEQSKLFTKKKILGKQSRAREK
jgi:hypothetical protein